MKPTLTAEQRSALAPYEHHLHTAHHADYVVALPQRVTQQVLFPIYRAVYGDNPGSPTCNYCVLNVCKRLARLYYAPQPATVTDEGKAEQKPATEKKTPKNKKKPTKNAKK